MHEPRLTRIAMACVAACAVALMFSPASAMAAETAPEVNGTWVSRVTATSVNLEAEINPGGLSTIYYFDYLTRAEYLANGEEFSGAATAPASGTAFLGFGNEPLRASQHVASLGSGTEFVYRVIAVNAMGEAVGPARRFVTESSATSSVLPDDRGWELVSPVDKNGGSIQGPGANAGGDVLQASAAGGAITYSSSSSFANAPVGAPPASQYISRRSGGGWETVNISTPALSGSYGLAPTGVPYQLFSPDLGLGLVLNGEPCRGEGSGCPVANQPLPGTEAPAGYQNYYLRNESGGFTALLTHADAPDLALEPSQFQLRFVGASTDLNHIVLSTCARLIASASEVPSGNGCDPAKPNLYLWSSSGLATINAAPGATLASPRGAVSEDGSRIYFYEAGKLYLSDNGTALLVAEGPELEFQTATPDGSFAFYELEGHLYRYDVSGHASADLTPSGGVVGVLGASDDGSVVYYEDANGIERWEESTTTAVAQASGAAQPSDFLPGTAGEEGQGTARVSPDGSELVFLSKESSMLSEYDNTDASSRATCGQPQGICDSEVYLFDASSGELQCVSCNPTQSRPLGPSTIPGVIANGTLPGSTEAYEPRVLSSGGGWLFFDSSDALLPGDTNNHPDVYRWAAPGKGSCPIGGTGCLGLISSGRGPDGATLVDTSADGNDAFFLTDESLVPADPGSADIYDARVGGGLAELPEEELCASDECAPLPATPEDPTVGTLTPGPANPPLVTERRCPSSKRRVVRHGKITCAPKKHGKGKKHHRRGKEHGHQKTHGRQARHRTQHLRRAGK